MHFWNETVVVTKIRIFKAGFLPLFFRNGMQPIQKRIDMVKRHPKIWKSMLWTFSNLNYGALKNQWKKVLFFTSEKKYYFFSPILTKSRGEKWKFIRKAHLEDFKMVRHASVAQTVSKLRTVKFYFSLHCQSALYNADQSAKFTSDWYNLTVFHFLTV